MVPLAMFLGTGRTVAETGTLVAAAVAAIGATSALDIGLEEDDDALTLLHPAAPMINKETDG
jgi:hypothetical protein